MTSCHQYFIVYKPTCTTQIVWNTALVHTNSAPQRITLDEFPGVLILDAPRHRAVLVLRQASLFDGFPIPKGLDGFPDIVTRAQLAGLTSGMINAVPAATIRIWAFCSFQ